MKKFLYFCNAILNLPSVIVHFNLSQRSDSTAQHRCEVTNRAGSDSASFKLTVSPLPVITALESVVEVNVAMTHVAML